MDLRDAFDTVAEVYDAVRPGYPAPLFDTIAELAGLSAGDAVLEVGCGSGQATEGFVARGYQVTALDPGPALIAAAERRFGPRDGLRFVTARFEDWTPPGAAFRLVAAGQAWHWAPPAQSFPNAARALAPGGWLAVFGHCPVAYPADFLEAARAAHQAHAPEAWGPPPESWYLPQGPVSGLFTGSGWFATPTHRAFPWTWRHTADSFRAFLTSRSDVQVLPGPRREPLITALSEGVAARGGELEIGYETHLYMAPLK